MILLFSISLFVLIFDQYSKYLISHNFKLYDSVPLLGNFLKLTFIKNPGAAFGFLADSLTGIRTPLFIFVSLALIIGIIVCIKKIVKEGIIYQISFGLILGGAVGNLIDRIRFGTVIDFIDIGFKSYRWPVFNFADSSICTGVFLIALFLFFKRKKDVSDTI